MNGGHFCRRVRAIKLVLKHTHAGGLAPSKFRRECTQNPVFFLVPSSSLSLCSTISGVEGVQRLSRPTRDLHLLHGGAATTLRSNAGINALS